MKFIITILALLVGLGILLTPTPTESQESPNQPIIIVGKRSPESYIKEYFGKSAPIMMAIARCESGLKQFNRDGSVLQGHIDPRDTGLFQINKFYHQATADEMEIDVDTTEGNVQYAKYLFDRNGTRDWKASYGCHGY